MEDNTEIEAPGAKPFLSDGAGDRVLLAVTALPLSLGAGLRLGAAGSGS